jgi:hypothetical protein
MDGGAEQLTRGEFLPSGPASYAAFDQDRISVHNYF